jgi:hypothetical protein
VSSCITFILQVMEDEICRVCNMHGRDEKCI